MKQPLIRSLSEVIAQRKEYITIDNETQYKRCRVQLHAKGIVLRDIVKGQEIKTKKQQVCKTDEFLVAEIDAKVGGFGLVPPDLDGAIVSTHYFLYSLDRSAISPEFLAILVKTPEFMEQVTAKGSTNYASIRPGDVLRYKVPVPPLPEQERIVQICNDVSDLVRRHHKAIESLEAVGTAFISETLGQFPSHKGGAR